MDYTRRTVFIGLALDLLVAFFGNVIRLGYGCIFLVVGPAGRLRVLSFLDRELSSALPTN